MEKLVAAANLLCSNMSQLIGCGLNSKTRTMFASTGLSMVLTVALTLGLVAPAQSAQALVPQPPQLAASAYILIDALTGKVIVENNADLLLPPASLTKMMTAYMLSFGLAAGNVALDDQVRISEKAWRTKGSRMFIQEGKLVKLEDLMRGIIIQSGNDASVAVA